MELIEKMERRLRLTPIHKFLDRPLYGSVSYSTTNCRCMFFCQNVSVFLLFASTGLTAAGNFAVLFLRSVNAVY